MSSAESKRQLRAQLRRSRRALDPARRALFDRAINQALVEFVQGSGCRTLAAYRAFDGEPDLSAALERLAALACRIALPVVPETGSGGGLTFREWAPGIPVRSNTLGIDEPERGSTIAVDDIDLLVIPLVGWDSRGHRLGMGAGYYDRALAFRRSCSRPVRLGVAYELQKVDELEAEDWDVPLHAIITERGRFTFAGASATMPPAAGLPAPE